jgi:hypothetical protein
MALAVGSAMAAPAAKQPIVTDHIAEVDGPVTTLAGPDDRLWAAWSYRASQEFDIAISLYDGSTTVWSAPVFLGRNSGSDELEPALAVDSRGDVYLAFATANPPRVALSTLAVGSTTWSEPIIVSGTEAASSPKLLVVGEELAVAFRTARGVGLIHLPTIGSGNQIQGIQDGNDPVDPAVKGIPVRSSGPQTDRTNLP